MTSAKLTPTVLTTRRTYGESADVKFSWFQAFNHLTLRRPLSHLLTSNAAPGGPRGKEAHHLPRGSSGRLLGASVARSPQSSLKQKQATWEASLCVLHKSQGKRKDISCPYTCILRTTSVITTSRYSRTDIKLCRDGPIYKAHTKKIEHRV